MMRNNTALAYDTDFSYGRKASLSEKKIKIRKEPSSSNSYQAELQKKQSVYERFMDLSFSWAEQLTKRLKHLEVLCKEEEDQKPVSVSSLNVFLFFLLKLQEKAIKKPQVTISFGGNIMAEWVMPDKTTVVLEFYPDSRIDFTFLQLFSVDPLEFKSNSYQGININEAITLVKNSPNYEVLCNARD